MPNILIVEDEKTIAEPLAFLLSTEGYETKIAYNGEEALELFNAQKPDLVLLDLMIPKISGLEVCERIRKKSSIPIIMLTAKNSELDIVLGLEKGADDYITKPYSMPELLARIRAALRRTQSVNDENNDIDLLNIKNIKINLNTHEVFKNNKLINLPLKEYELLEYLFEISPRVATRNAIIDRVWGSDYYGDTKTLDVHIKRLRNKLEEDPAAPEVILTVRGVGYRVAN